MRKSWETHWMQVAEHAAEMCTCAAGRKVGAAFVRDKRLLATGFNGVPTGFPHPLQCPRKLNNVPSGEKLDMCGCAHAEMNGITNAAREGISLKGSTLFCTTEPCALCMGALANVGVKEILYKDSYHHEMSKLIAEKANINVLQFTPFGSNGFVKLEEINTHDFID